MTACSGILFLYYRIALYNRSFHQFNRFYLLASIILSVTIPLIHIELAAPVVQENRQVFRLLNIVAAGNNFDHEEIVPSRNFINISNAGMVIYILISLCMLFFLFLAVRRVIKLVRLNGSIRLGRIHFVNTSEKDAPFSFFNYVFWHQKIDISSSEGQKILDHETIHVNDLHSADRLFMNIIIVLFWCNPFFWLMRKEMELLHEFIADRRTIDIDDTRSFSEMILLTAFPGNHFAVTSNFSSSSIKRRLLMLTKTNSSIAAKWSRILILPVLFLLVAGFTFSSKQMAKSEFRDSASADKTITIVIDAGHGGADNGAMALDGTPEKDITLAIARKVQLLNTNKNIRIRLTRTEDRTQSVKEKVDWSVNQKPDAFISLHAGSETGDASGFDIYISNKNNSYAEKAQILGSLLSGEIGKIYSIAPELKKRAEQGIWVLDAPSIAYPALLIECGNMANSKDLLFIQNSANQDRVAKSILNAIERFADKPIVFQAVSQDTVPAISSIDVMKSKDSVLVKYNNGTIKALKSDELMAMSSDTIVFRASPVKSEGKAEQIILNGKPITHEEFQKLNTSEIKSITVTKKEIAGPEPKTLTFITISEKKGENSSK